VEAARATAAAAPNSWAEYQKSSQKNREIDGSYLCLHQFDKFLKLYFNLLKLTEQKFEKRKS